MMERTRPRRPFAEEMAKQMIKIKTIKNKPLEICNQQVIRARHRVIPSGRVESLHEYSSMEKNRNPRQIRLRASARSFRPAIGGEAEEKRLASSAIHLRRGARGRSNDFANARRRYNCKGAPGNVESPGVPALFA